MTLTDRFRFFRENAGGVVGRSAQVAFEFAHAEMRAEEMGLTVTWENDDLPWDADCPAPRFVYVATVLRPGSTLDADARFPYIDRPDGTVARVPSVLASLGGIGVDSRRDPYLRVVSAELFAEALEVLDEETEDRIVAGVESYAHVATYAGVP